MENSLCPKMEAALRSVRFRGSSQAEIEESELRRLRLLLVGSLNRLQQGHRKTDDGGKLRFGGAKTSLVSPKMSSKWEAKKQQQAATRVGPRLLLFIFLVVFGWAFWLDTALTTLATVNGQPADSPASPAPLEQQPPPNGGQQLEPTGQLESWSVPAASQQQLERAPSGGSSRKAQLAEPENNNQVHRVAVGRSVRFKCTVNEIGAHKLAWFHKDRRLLLALDNKTVAWRERIQVSSQANKVFFLQIDSVQLSDKVSEVQIGILSLPFFSSFSPPLSPSFGPHSSAFQSRQPVSLRRDTLRPCQRAPLSGLPALPEGAPPEGGGHLAPREPVGRLESVRRVWGGSRGRFHYFIKFL